MSHVSRLFRSALPSVFIVAVTAASPLAAQQRVPLPAKDRPLALNARTLFQVGEVDGEDYENFGNITDLAFGPDGSLYVLDATARRVVVFDAQGRFVRTVGRPGDGPGEFGFPSAIAVLRTGELVVNDGAKASLQLFSPAGEFLRSATLDEELGRAVGRMRVVPTGTMITETMAMRRLLEGAQRAPAQRLQLPPRSVTALRIGDSITGRRLFNAPPRETKFSAPQTSAGGMHVTMSMTAFEPSLLWTPLRDGGVAALQTASYRIGLTDPNGRPDRYLERAIEPRRVTAADRKRYLENWNEGKAQGASAVVVGFRGGGDAGHAGGALRAAPSGPLTLPDIKESDVTWGDVIPVIRQLGTDSWGRLWVQRADEDQVDGPIDLIDARLQYLGTLPDQPMPRAFGPDGRLAYIIRDDLDVQRVVVKQLVR